jgi:hypothetical protein
MARTASPRIDEELLDAVNRAGSVERRGVR